MRGAFGGLKSAATRAFAEYTKRKEDRRFKSPSLHQGVTANESGIADDARPFGDSLR